MVIELTCNSLFFEYNRNVKFNLFVSEESMEYQRDEHRVHLIVFHLVWTPKRRKSVLVGEIAKDCEEIIRRKCEEKGWTVVELAICPDHIHLFVRAFPDTCASDIFAAV